MVLVQKEVKAVYLGTHKVRPAVTERPDIDTYTHAQSTTQESNLHALTVSPDGTNLYIANTSYLYQYSMTSGDISTLSFVRRISFNSRGLDITSDGSNIYSIKD